MKSNYLQPFYGSGKYCILFIESGHIFYKTQIVAKLFAKQKQKLENRKRKGKIEKGRCNWA
jgi:hypothetical protein